MHAVPLACLHAACDWWDPGAIRTSAVGAGKARLELASDGGLHRLAANRHSGWRRLGQLPGQCADALSIAASLRRHGPLRGAPTWTRFQSAPPAPCSRLSTNSVGRSHAPWQSAAAVAAMFEARIQQGNLLKKASLGERRSRPPRRCQSTRACPQDRGRRAPASDRCDGGGWAHSLKLPRAAALPAARRWWRPSRT